MIAKSIASALALSLAACATIGEGRMYLEPSIKPGQVTLHRVAIVPNRLPVSLQDPEKWRRYNYDLLHDAFQQHGIEVVDYDTTVRVFEKSGLPMEDTKSSRDKWADLAEQLGVDAVVLPYYGTFGSVDGSILISHHFISVTTLQIYLAGQNDFFSRLDLGGDSSYTTGFTTIASFAAAVAVMIVSLAVKPSPPTFDSSGQCTSSCGGSSSGLDAAGIAGIVSTGTTLLGLVIDIIAGSGSSDSHWEHAFAASVDEGLEPFFRTVSSGGSSSSTSPRRAPPPPPAPEPPAPPPSSRSSKSAWGAVKPQSAPPLPPRDEPPPPPPPAAEPSPIRPLTPDNSSVIRPLDSGASVIRALPPAGGGIRALGGGFSLTVTGSDATPNVRQACEQAVREGGIALAAGGAIAATVTLGSGHAKLDITTPKHGAVLHRDLPASSAETLCRQVPAELRRAEEKEAQ